MVEVSIGGVVHFVTEDQARALVLILDRRVLEVKNACVSINFDKDGVMQTIERRDFLYSKRHDG